MLYNSIVVFLAEIMGYVVSGVLAKRVGRRSTLVCSFLSIVVFGILFSVLGLVSEYLGYVCLFFVKTGASGVININYLFLAELFPTSVRGTVMGITNFFARLGCIVAPFVSEYLENWSLIVYSVLGVACLFIVRKLPETKGRPLIANLKMMDKTNQ